MSRQLHINTLRLKLVALLKVLDETLIEYKRYSLVVDNDDDDGMWKLLKFHNYQEYFDCMVQIGFINNERNRTKLPYFVQKNLNDVSDHRFQFVRDAKKALEDTKDNLLLMIQIDMKDSFLRCWPLDIDLVPTE